MTEPFYKRQPVLAGCLGCLSVGILAGVGLLVFIGLLGKGCYDMSGKALGVESFGGLLQDAMAQGYGLQVQNEVNGSTVIQMPPMEPRKVTCDDLQAVYFPHLTGELETLTLESISYEPGPDGSLQSVPIQCSWSGYPTPDTPLGSAGSGAAGE